MDGSGWQGVYEHLKKDGKGDSTRPSARGYLPLVLLLAKPHLEFLLLASIHCFVGRVLSETLRRMTS